MPELLRDSLEQVRDAPMQQQQHEQLMAQLLHHNRRKTLIGFSGLAILGAAIVSPLSGLPLLVTAFVGSLLLSHGLRR
jgi:hypothetical protein